MGIEEAIDILEYKQRVAKHMFSMLEHESWKIDYEVCSQALIALKEKQERENKVEQLDGYSFEVGV